MIYKHYELTIEVLERGDQQRRKEFIDKVDLYKTMRYDELRERFASNLETAARAQEAGDLPGIETGFAEVDRMLPGGEGAEYDKLHIARYFWDGWIDARNHDWQYYEGIAEQGWPQLARLLATDLRADREPQETRILQHFDLRRAGTQPSLLERLMAKLKRQ